MPKPVRHKSGAIVFIPTEEEKEIIQLKEIVKRLESRIQTIEIQILNSRKPDIKE